MSPTLRRHDLDNLRTYLTGHVIVFHTAMAYGRSSRFWFTSLLFGGHQSPLLTAFVGYSQTFFMGIFFWVSGRMSAQSLSRADSTVAFLRGKLRRLGIPALAYSVIIFPAVKVMALPRWDATSVVECLHQQWRVFRGIRGPVWYASTLLAFDLCSAVAVGAAASPPSSRRLHAVLTQGGWLAVAAGNRAIRTGLSTRGPKFMPLIGGDPGCILQYVYAYVLGFLAFHEGRPRMLSPFERTLDHARDRETGQSTVSTKNETSGYAVEEASLSLSTAAAVSLCSTILCFTPSLLLIKRGGFTQSLRDSWGGWNASSAPYALWTEFSFVVVGPALMSLFRRRYNRPVSASSIWSPRYSYAAFFVHIPVSVAIEVAVDTLLFLGGEPRTPTSGMAWKVVGPVIMTGFVGMANVLASFTLGRWLVRYVPGVDQFL